MVSFSVSSNCSRSHASRSRGVYNAKGAKIVCSDYASLWEDTEDVFLKCTPNE